MKLRWVFLLGAVVLQTSTPIANAWGADAIIHLDPNQTNRDAIMKNGILQVGQYPDIIFYPKQVEGTRDVDGAIHGWMTGLMRLHGDSHEMRILLNGRVDGQKSTAECQFLIPYTQWGVESPNGLTSTQITDATKAANVGSEMFSLFAYVLPILRKIPPNLFGVSDFVQLNLETAGQISWPSNSKIHTLTVIQP
jgi:hypothetical protein